MSSHDALDVGQTQPRASRVCIGPFGEEVLEDFAEFFRRYARPMIAHVNAAEADPMTRRCSRVFFSHRFAVGRHTADVSDRRYLASAGFTLNKTRAWLASLS